MSAGGCVRALVELGFTGLEAEVYTALVQNPPMTGYRVAQVLGKPAANVYKAIESLQAKGAVMIEEGVSRVCHAAPPEELLGLLERGFRESRERAATALAELQSVPADDRVYQLRSREQVMERCRRMLERAERVALLDAFPGPLEELRAGPEAAAARGVTVAVKAYEPTSLREAEVFVHPGGRDVIGRWPGQWVNVVVDGREHLLALLTRDGRGFTRRCGARALTSPGSITAQWQGSSSWRTWRGGSSRGPLRRNCAACGSVSAGSWRRTRRDSRNSCAASTQAVSGTKLGRLRGRESINLKRQGRAHVPPTHAQPRVTPASGRGRDVQWCALSLRIGGPPRPQFGAAARGTARATRAAGVPCRFGGGPPPALPV